MAVLCEALSVIIRFQSVRRYFKGGEAAFVHIIPNETFCSDGELLRVGFMTPDDVDEFVELLKFNGLQSRANELDDQEDSLSGAHRHDHDFVVVDQLQGFAGSCEWMECWRMRIADTSWVTVACLKGPAEYDGAETQNLSAEALEDHRLHLHAPLGWVFDGSLSDRPAFVDVEDLPRRLRFIREEGDRDVYWDTDTGNEVFVVRTR